MAPIPEYPGIRPAHLSTYTQDYGDLKGAPMEGDSISYSPPSFKAPRLAHFRPAKKMKDKAMKEEVRGAVNEYLNSLISERSRPGQGMAISAHDLMVAAKTAGQHGTLVEIKPIQASKAEADKILERFTKPPVIIIKPSTAGSNGDGRRSIQVHRAKSVPAAGDNGGPRPKKAEKKDYHWLMWKTTPTPVVPTPAVSAPKTPAPPMTPSIRPPSSRARSVVSRAYTPALSPPLEAPLSPDPFRTPTAPPPERRGFTPAPPTPATLQCRIPTPMSLQPEYHDNMASPQMFPTAKYDGNSGKGTSKAFVPALNAWVANATDQEKEVAFSLLKTLQTGMTPLKIAKVKAKPKPKARAASAAGSRAPPGGPTQLYRLPAAGVRTSAPASKAYLDRNIEDQYLKLVAKSLQTNGPSDYRYTAQETTSRPWPTHLARAAAPIEYTHENSFFQWTRPSTSRDFVIRPDWVSERPRTTNQFSYSASTRKNSMPTYRSHFTIHPEWVSETAAGKRDMKLLSCTQGPNGIRYMAQRT